MYSHQETELGFGKELSWQGNCGQFSREALNGTIHHALITGARETSKESGVSGRNDYKRENDIYSGMHLMQKTEKKKGKTAANH